MREEVLTLAIVTRNPLRKINMNLLKAVLEASLQVPYLTAIIVDDGSDGAGEEMKSILIKHDKEVILTRSPLKKTRAAARQHAIDLFMQLTTSKYLMFLDDDVILKPGWWLETKRLLNEPKVGEVWGIAYDVVDRPYSRVFASSNVEYLIKSFQARGGTHDTVFYREALKNINIPYDIIMEDAIIHNYVKCRGFASRINMIGAIHLHPPLTEDLLNLIKLTISKIKLLVKYGIDTDIEARGSIIQQYNALRNMGEHIALGYIAYSIIKSTLKTFKRRECAWITS